MSLFFLPLPICVNLIDLRASCLQCEEEECGPQITQIDTDLIGMRMQGTGDRLRLSRIPGIDSIWISYPSRFLPEEMEGLESWLAPPQTQLTTR
jgi:hypothetical protein